MTQPTRARAGAGLPSLTARLSRTIKIKIMK
jgi:hypothetical protein